ncbi:hypothetical protein DUI87_04094 [Hirundo rustica rustica]|uniref:Uncharacterized protein n=1 Tax=Hirundo rustica rustica TaxID=333673 RepID=A0A3M0L1P2_HIRRU|nr:hypothetical protein DUI87_04094 [Hirundo rustica rustica]
MFKSWCTAFFGPLFGQLLAEVELHAGLPLIKHLPTLPERDDPFFAVMVATPTGPVAGVEEPRPHGEEVACLACDPDPRVFAAVCEAELACGQRLPGVVDTATQRKEGKGPTCRKSRGLYGISQVVANNFQWSKQIPIFQLTL